MHWIVLAHHKIQASSASHPGLLAAEFGCAIIKFIPQHWLPADPRTDEGHELALERLDLGIVKNGLHRRVEGLTVVLLIDEHPDFLVRRLSAQHVVECEFRF
jgi:hypothetical protein